MSSGQPHHPASQSSCHRRTRARTARPRRVGQPSLHQLALSDISDKGLSETKALCSAKGVTTQTHCLDVSDREAIYKHAKQVAKEFEQINIIINNAGVNLSVKAQDTNIKDFEWLMDINFWGVVHGCQAFLPELIKSGDGHVVNISSMFGLISVPKQAAYNAAKFAVRGYTEALRQELIIDKQPVKVSCVHPGFIATNIANSTRHGKNEDAESNISSFNKVARTSPEKAAKVIVSGIQNNKARILIGPDSYAADSLQRLFGAQYQKITQALARKFMY